MNDDIQEIKESIKKINDRINELTKRIQKFEKKQILKSQDPTSYEIIKEEEWDWVEKNLHKTGIILEYEIAKYLFNTGLVYEQNDEFFYPKEDNQFYTDFLFGENISSAQKLSVNKFETDIKIWEYFYFDNDNRNFKIKVIIHYFIECKSRNNPPLNYLIIPKRFQDDPKFFPLYSIHSSAFFNQLWIKSNRFSETSQEPIGIQYGNFAIDDKETFKEAFWELFRAIDRQSSCALVEILPLNNFFNQYYYEGIPFPDDMNVPDYYKKFNEFYEELIRKDKIPPKLMKKINISFELYVPIIVVNGNIYSINMNHEKNGKLFEKQEKIPAFVKRYDYIKHGRDSNIKFIHWPRFIMKYLKKNEICFKDESFYPSLNEPALDLLIISKNNFRSIFNLIQIELHKELSEKIDKIKENLYLKKIEELKRFQTFSWILAHNIKWKDQLLRDLYDEYSKIKGITINTPDRLRKL